MSEARIAALEAAIEELRSLVTANPRRAFMQDVVRFRLVASLPELTRKHPGGVSARHVADHFGFPLATVQAAIKGLVDRGKIERVRRPRQKETVIILPGQRVPDVAPPTEKQRRVLAALVDLSINGKIEMSLTAIALRLGFQPSTLHYVLRCLILDRRVIVVKRGAKGKPSAYFIPSAVS